MDRFQGIIAEIFSNGQRLSLYDDTDSREVEESHARHQYVEAVAGSTFQVRVSLTPQFNFYKMKPEHAVAIYIKIDEETTDSGLSVAQAQELGRIQVTVQRVKMEKRQNPIPKVSALHFMATINEVPEKALKGRPIETTLRFANARPISNPSVSTEKAKSLGGEAGKPVVFNIYYRSRRALQMLGCIPRSPSLAIDISDDENHEPVVRPASNRSDTDNSNDESDTRMALRATSSDKLRRETEILKARITDLERANVETEAANTGTVIKDEGVSIKREREEGDSKERLSQRLRTSVEIEHVDLTDD